MRAVSLLSSLDLKWWESNMKPYRNFNIYLFLITLSVITAQDSYPVNSKVIAQIREEGLQRSEIINTLSYMTDVIGARLTNSKAMYEAQDWVCLLYTSPSPRDRG